MSNVYVILNESIIRGVDNPVTEIVQPIHLTLEGALSALAEIGAEYGIELDAESTENSLYLPTQGTPYESDEYYIEEVEIVD